MVQTINQSQFIDAFKTMGRETQFSYNALCALFDYFEEHEGDAYQLDVIELCCSFTEFTSLEELNNFYNNNGHPDNNFNLEELEYFTTVIPVEKGHSYLVYNF